MLSICLNKQRRWTRSVITAGLMLAMPLAAWLSPAAAAELRLYAAAGVKAPLEQVARDFEAATGHRIVLLFDTAGAAEQRFIADPAATFLVTTEARLQAAEQGGRLRNGKTSLIGATVGGLAAPPDGARPAIATPAQLRAALLAAPRIAFSDPARGATVGKHFLQVIEELGISEQVLRKATLARDGVETMHLVLEGKADLGVTQISEIVQADARALLGPFPDRFDLATTYALWMSADAAPEARAFAALVTSPAERARLRAHGLRPPE
ncbi:MAG: molybdate ABC transporter substrate-binding protein [Burkholderiaceae bacterium]